MALLDLDEGRPARAGVWTALAALLKPQFLLFVPLLGCVWLRRADCDRSRCPGTARLVAGFAATLGLLAGPFIVSGGLRWVERGYSRGFHDAGSSLTVTAFNLWWLLTDLLPIRTVNDRLLGVACKPLALALTAALGGTAGLLYLRGRERPLAGLATIYLVGCFFFLTGMNERFLVYGLCSLCAWAVAEPRVRAAAVLLSAAQVVNLLHNALWQPCSRWSGYLPTDLSAPLSWACAAAVAVVLARALWQFVRVRRELRYPPGRGNRTTP